MTVFTDNFEESYDYKDAWRRMALANSTPDDWKALMYLATKLMLKAYPYNKDIDPEHTAKTPIRFVEAMKEYLAGSGVSAKQHLEAALFKNPHPNSQMIHTRGVEFYSMCAHHLAPFFGTIDFAYIPDVSIVGLSKVPRMINVLSRRLQIQENLTTDIVATFNDVVKPKGCAALVRGYHLCMCGRGVRAKAFTTSTAVRGAFENESTKNEFLQEANTSPTVWS